MAKKWVSAKEQHARGVIGNPDATAAQIDRAGHTVAGVQSKHNRWEDKERRERKARNAKLLSDGSRALGKLGRGWLW